jgi:hypothetical protein
MSKHFETEMQRLDKEDLQSIYEGYKTRIANIFHKLQTNKIRTNKRMSSWNWELMDAVDIFAEETQKMKELKKKYDYYKALLDKK